MGIVPGRGLRILWGAEGAGWRGEVRGDLGNNGCECA